MATTQYFDRMIVDVTDQSEHPLGLAAARARGRNGGAPFTMTPAKLRLAQAAMGKPETKVADLCAELGITRQTLYRFVDPKGDLRSDGEKLLSQRSRKS